MARKRRTKAEIEQAKASGELFRDQSGGNRSRKVEGKSRSERGVDRRKGQGGGTVDPEREAESLRKFKQRLDEKKRADEQKAIDDQIAKEEKEQREKKERIDELNRIQAETDEFDSKVRAKREQGFDMKEAEKQVERDDRRAEIAGGSDSARKLAIEDFAEEFEQSDSDEAREIDAQIRTIYDGTGIRRPTRQRFLESHDRFFVDGSGEVTVLPITENITGFEEAQRRAKRGKVTLDMIREQAKLTDPKSLTDIDDDHTTFAKDGFFGFPKAGNLIVGEKNKKEFVSIKPMGNIFNFTNSKKNKAINNIFDMSNKGNPMFDMSFEFGGKKKKKKGKKSNDFDFMSGF